ncbi:rhodanese-like domain-containing protein [Bernardetia sp.]|uniref:rhodanese-like domain-containing protein n=1 Tax=Bernardetia sp. TaxID=1937974 RepID=UPI0025BE0CA0|nr:rhodanese-like domain-containing protein [Bernardetia sp.]
MNNFLIAAVFFITCLIFPNLYAQEGKKSNDEKIDNIEQLAPKEVFLLLQQDSVLMIDVREKTELATISYDVDSIIHIPVSDFLNKFEIQSKEFSANTKLIIACRSGRRSQKIAKELQKKGYLFVYNLKEGIIEWEKQGFKVKKEKAVEKNEK